MRAMDKLAATVTDAGMRKDLDASVTEEEVNPSDASAVVRKAEPKLLACNPTEIEGCVFFVVSVEKEGNVSAVDPYVSDGLPREVLDCLTGVLKEARFAAVPKAGKMTVPVTFTRGR